MVMGRGTAGEWKIEQNWELGQPPPELKDICPLGSNAFSGLGLAAVGWHTQHKQSTAPVQDQATWCGRFGKLSV